MFGYENSHLRADTSSPGASGFASMAIIKHNICQNSTVAFTQPFHYFAEPFFVPRPGGVLEDDGVVLVLAQDGSQGTGVMFVLDAGNMTLMATIPLPVLTTIKTHGRFVWRGALGA